ncbi:MAG: nucleotide exchange factor GrpE [Janthinobacterium lividum]
MTADGTHAPRGFSNPDAAPGGVEIPLYPGAPAPEGPLGQAALQAELDDMRDHWMRAEAEIANVRARAKRDVEDARQYAVQKFATDVVEAAENLRRGLDSLPPPSPAEPEIVRRLRDGLASIERSFVGVLERNGVHREDPTGAPFNPDRHQAMSEQDTHGHPPGTVLQAYTPAWTLNGRLIRPAMVVVAKAPPSPQAFTRAPRQGAFS